MLFPSFLTRACMHEVSLWCLGRVADSVRKECEWGITVSVGDGWIEKKRKIKTFFCRKMVDTKYTAIGSRWWNSSGRG